MQIFNTALRYPVRPSDRRLGKTKKCYRTDRYDASNLPLSDLQLVQTKVHQRNRSIVLCSATNWEGVSIFLSFETLYNALVKMLS
jgi:hypothetical protein